MNCDQCKQTPQAIICNSCYLNSISNAKYSYTNMIGQKSNIVKFLHEKPGINLQKVQELTSIKQKLNEKMRLLDNLKQKNQNSKLFLNHLNQIKDKLNYLLDQKNQEKQVLLKNNENLTKENQDIQARLHNLRIAKITAFRKIYSIHPVYPNLEVPLLIYVKDNEYTDIFSSNKIETRMFKELEVIGSPSLGYSPVHSNAITDSLNKIAELLGHIALIQEVKLPINLNKQEGIFWLSYVNNFKLHKLQLNGKITLEFMDALTLLFINFLYLCKINRVPLKISRSRNELKSDILNLNILCDHFKNNNDNRTNDDSGQVEINENNRVMNQEYWNLSEEFNFDVIDSSRPKTIADDFEIIEEDS